MEWEYKLQRFFLRLLIEYLNTFKISIKQIISIPRQSTSNFINFAYFTKLSIEYGIAKSTINGWIKDVKEIKVDGNGKNQGRKWNIKKSYYKNI